METKSKTVLLETVAAAYALLTIKTADEGDKDHSDKIWYKQAKEVSRYFTKRSRVKLNESERILINKKYDEIIEFDSEYFKDQKYSPYVCMFNIMEYLILELRDTSLRVKFGHWEFLRIKKEIYEMFKKVGMDSDRYVGNLLDKLD